MTPIDLQSLPDLAALLRGHRTDTPSAPSAPRSMLPRAVAAWAAQRERDESQSLQRATTPGEDFDHAMRCAAGEPPAEPAKE